MIDQKPLRDFLQDALINGRLRNPSYSLRALAQKAGLSPAALSEILKGKRRISIKRATKILMKMNANPEQLQKILLGMNKINSHSLTTANQHKLSIDQFYLIAEWYHFAILSLSETENFNDNSYWISKRLNVPVNTVVKALERLERLKLLKRNHNGRLIPSELQLFTPDEISHRGLKQQHAEILNKCLNSLEHDSIEKRDFLGVTMTLNPKDLPLAKKLLRKFVVKFCNQLEEGEKKEVYRLNIQFIPLSKNREES